MQMTHKEQDEISVQQFELISDADVILVYCKIFVSINNSTILVTCI